MGGDPERRGGLDRRRDDLVVRGSGVLDRRVKARRAVVTFGRVEDRDVTDLRAPLERSARTDAQERLRANPGELLERDRG